MHSFDVLVVGAGPSAIATLAACSKDKTVGIVTGVVDENLPDKKDVHSKIQVVSLEKSRRPGLAGEVFPKNKHNKKLYASAELGGFANYWGQQFIRYGRNDPYGKNVFRDYEQYLEDCSVIENMFSISEYRTSDWLSDNFLIHEPRLLTGTAFNKDAELDSMREAFSYVSKGKKVFDDRVVEIKKTSGGGCSVVLSNGISISAKNIFLCAGVIGTSQIILNSCPKVEQASFKDHAPYMAYCIGMRRLFRNKTRKHFNAYTLERNIGDCCDIFSSIYDMSETEFNLLLASTIGRSFSFLRGLSSPKLSSFLQPVQIWTKKSSSKVKIYDKGASFEAETNNLNEDEDLSVIKKVLQTLGGKVLHVSHTLPGLSFHYHDLKFMNQQDVIEEEVNKLLQRYFGEAVRCSDASILNNIGTQPHTLTAMAAAYRYVYNFLK